MTDALAAAEWDDLRANAARDYLEDVKDAQRRIEMAEEEIAEIMSRLEGGAIRYDKPNVQTSPSDDKIPCGVADLIKAKENLSSAIPIFKNEVSQAVSMLCEIDGKPGFILRFHYLMGMTYKEIAQRLGISEATVYLKRQEGLISLYEMGLPMPYRIPDVKAI